jgi:hypothetical protein
MNGSAVKTIFPSEMHFTARYMRFTAKIRFKPPGVVKFITTKNILY